MATPNMNLDKPVVSGTGGPLWATMLNAISDLIDVHDHSSGKGVPVTPSGMSITSALAFGSNDATALRSTRFTSQSALFSLAADVNAAYVKDGELYFRDASGNNVKITNGGVLNAAALSANYWTQSDKSADYTILAADTFAHLRMDATAGNRVVTLPSAAAVSEGRFYFISDSAGQCSATRTITVQRAGSDSLGDGSGPSSVTIESKFGAVLVVRVGSGTWYVFRQNQLATTTTHGSLMLANDLGGTGHAPTVTNITGSGGQALIRMQVFQWDDIVTSPTLMQEATAGASGQELVIAAQAAATNGGQLTLKGGDGSGAATHGSTKVFVGGTEVLSAIANASPYVRAGGSGGVKFASALTGPFLAQEDRTTGGTGASLGIKPQTGHTNSAGGNLNLFGGEGAGSGDGGNIVLSGGDDGGTGVPGAVRIDAYAGGDTLMEVRQVAALRNVIALCGGVSTAKMPLNTGNGVVFVNNAATAPTSDPVGGFILYSTGGVFAFRNEAGNRMSFPAVFTTGTPTNGSGSAPPALPDGYITITYNGATYKLAAYRGA